MQKKSLYHNSFYSILYRVINVIYPMITATYVSRVLKPAGVGAVSVAQTLCQFLVVCACLGTPNYGTRKISTAGEGPACDRVFSELFIDNMCSSVIIGTLYYLVIFFLPAGVRIDKRLYYIEGLLIFLNIFNTDWFYEGKEEFKYITIRCALVKLTAIFLVFYFVREEGDLRKFAAIFVLSFALSYAFNLFHLKGFARFTLKDIHPSVHLYPILLLAVTYISNEIYVTSDTLMVGAINGNAMAGYYSNAMKLVKILTHVCAAIGVALLPRLNKLHFDGNDEHFRAIVSKASAMLFWFSSACTAGLLLTSDRLVTVLFGEAFKPAAPILNVLCFLVLFRSFSTVFLQVLLCFQEDKRTTAVYFSAMAMNLVLNGILIPFFEGVGASLASVLSELTICIALFVHVRRHMSISFERRYLFSQAVSLAGMSLAVMLVKRTVAAGDLTVLALQILSGIAVYFALNYATGNSAFLDLFEHYRKRLLKR